MSEPRTQSLPAGTAPSLAMLTPRELETVEHIVAGLTNKEIAMALKISPRTVEVFRQQARVKLEAKNTAALVTSYLRLKAMPAPKAPPDVDRLTEYF